MYDENLLEKCCILIIAPIYREFKKLYYTVKSAVTHFSHSQTDSILFITREIIDLWKRRVMTNRIQNTHFVLLSLTVMSAQ